MKQIIRTMLALGLLLNVNVSKAQSSINFSSFVGGVVFAHIYGPDTNNPGATLTGNISTLYSATTPNGDFPTGATTYGGCLLGGAATGPTNEFDFTNGFLYTAQLWAAPGDNAPESSLLAVPWYSTTLRTGPGTNSAGFIAPLSFTAANPDPGIPFANGGSVTCQVRVWYNAGGAIGNWNEALVSGTLLGTSQRFNADGLPASSDFPPSLPANLTGLQSFNLYWPYVMPTLPLIFNQPVSTSAPLGGSAQFAVEAEQAITLQWQCNGTNLTNNARISGADSDALSISDVRLADAGSYRVVLQNYSGATTSTAATLAVTVTAPEVQQSSFSLPGDSFVLFCPALPDQLYQLQWAANLDQPSWLNLGSPLTATNSIVAATVKTTNSQEFYRIVLLAQ